MIEIQQPKSLIRYLFTQLICYLFCLNWIVGLVFQFILYNSFYITCNSLLPIVKNCLITVLRYHLILQQFIQSNRILSKRKCQDQDLSKYKSFNIFQYLIFQIIKSLVTVFIIFIYIFKLRVLSTIIRRMRSMISVDICFCSCSTISLSDTCILSKLINCKFLTLFLLFDLRRILRIIFFFQLKRFNNTRIRRSIYQWRRWTLILLGMTHLSVGTLIIISTTLQQIEYMKHLNISYIKQNLNNKVFNFDFELIFHLFDNFCFLVHNVIQIGQEKMSGRWSSRSNHQDDLPDFQKLFNSADFSVFDLLDIDSIVEQVKRAGNKFTDIFINHRQIVFDLIDIALRPQDFGKTHETQINLDMVNKSVQILTNQSDQFSDFLVGAKPKEQQGEDTVLSDEIQQRDWGVFEHLMKSLGETRVNQTSCAYLNKILTSVIYQKGSAMIQMLRGKSEIQQILVKHYYSKSISELFWKMIEMEEGNNFFEKDKVILLKKIPYLLEKQERIQFLIESMENVVILYQQLMLKNEDIYDKTKYISMSREIINQFHLYQFIINTFNKFDNQKPLEALFLQLLDVLLRFNTLLKETHSSKNQQSMDSSVLQIKINQDIIKFVAKFIVQIFNRIIIQTKNNFSKIYYCKIIYSLMLIDECFTDSIFTEEFVAETLKLIIKNPNNNLLHNILKEIYIQAVKQSDEAIKIILCQKTNFLATCKSVLSQKNSQFSYDNQIYHILTALYNKITTKGGQIDQSKIELSTDSRLKELFLITQKKQIFYNTDIGINPKKQTHSWDCSSNQIKINTVEKPSFFNEKQEGTNQTNHWIDSQLPLDSDDSEEQITQSPKNQQIEKVNEQKVMKEQRNKYLQQQRQNTPQKAQIEEKSFNKYYSTYMKFTVEDLMGSL